MIVSLTEIKNHLGISGSDDDTPLGYYLNAISEWVPKYLGRAVEEAEFVERFDGDEIKDAIYLNNFPITEFKWLKYRSGVYSDEQMTDFNADDYQRDDAAGIIYVDVMYSGVRNIEVYYKGGYAAADIPDAIKVAAMKLVAKIYNKRRSDGFSSEEVAGARVEWEKFLSSDIEELLRPYKSHKL
jgi:hypothetical protein